MAIVLDERHDAASDLSTMVESLRRIPLAWTLFSRESFHVVVSSPAVERII